MWFIKNLATVKVKTWDGQERLVQKAELRAELDGDHGIFFKIEGRYENQTFMIDYFVDRVKAIDVYNQLMQLLIIEQERYLEDYVENYF